MKLPFVLLTSCLYLTSSFLLAEPSTDSHPRLLLFPQESEKQETVVTEEPQATPVQAPQTVDPTPTPRPPDPSKPVKPAPPSPTPRTPKPQMQPAPQTPEPKKIPPPSTPNQQKAPAATSKSLKAAHPKQIVQQPSEECQLEIDKESSKNPLLTDASQKPVIERKARTLQPSPRPGRLIVDSRGQVVEEDMQVNKMESDEKTSASLDCCKPAMVCCQPVAPLCVEVRPGDDSCIWASGEFLYWKASVPNLDYGLSNNSVYFQRINIPQKGLRTKLLKNDYDWEPGFRISLGGTLPHDSWELIAQYTWYRGKGSSTTYQPTGFGNQPTSLVTPVYPIGNLVSTIADASATFNSSSVQNSDQSIESKIHLDYQVGDLVLAHRLHVSNYLDLKILTGLEGCGISQNWMVTNFDGPISFPSITPIINNSLKWKFNGGGLLLGLNTDWYMCKSLSLYIKGAFSMLYGQHTTSLYTAPEDGFFINAPINDFTSKHMRIATHSQLAIGLSWAYEFECALTSIEVFAGYELHAWTNLHEVYRNTEDHFQAPDLTQILITSPVFRSVDNGPLTIQGIHAGLGFHF